MHMQEVGKGFANGDFGRPCKASEIRPQDHLKCLDEILIDFFGESNLYNMYESLNVKF